MTRMVAGVWEMECVRRSKAASCLLFLEGVVKYMIGWQVELLSFLCLCSDLITFFFSLGQRYTELLLVSYCFQFCGCLYS